MWTALVVLYVVGCIVFALALCRAAAGGGREE